MYVVDDDRGVLDSIDALLKTAGWNVRTYSCPLAFLENCPSDASGCLLLDVHMPGLNGPQVLAAIRQRGMQLPVIFVSGHSQVDAPMIEVDPGAHYFLEKPVRGWELIEYIKLVMSR